MKKSIFQFVFILTICCQYLNGNAQFVPSAAFPFYGETDNTFPIDAIGIGDFTTPGATPNAALDIVVPYLSNNGLIYQGEAFRTKVDSRFDHTWKMWTFPETPKFFVLNPGAVLLPSHLAYDGSASVNDIHLNLKQKGNMNFFTNNTLWMRLREQGYLGLSDDWRNFTPLSLLHLNQKGNANLFAQWTNGNTGINVTDGLRIGIEYNAGYTGANKSFAKFIQREDAPMKFYTNNSDRMIINAAYAPTIHLQSVNTTGYVGIGANNFWGEESGGEGPRSLLHLQGPFNAFTNGGNGWRTWNKTGVYINENSDEMYIGLKNEFVTNGTNRSDAVIMWGDDQANINDGTADNFRLIFSGGFGNGAGNGGTNPRDPLTLNGLETMRMTPFGKMGIGPLFNFALPPSRRLEILDFQNGFGTSIGEPQLRLTFTQTTSLGTGIYTDFQTTNSGDLYIHPASGLNDRRVGINTPTPRNTLEINSVSTSSTPGSSGLRFTKFTTASTITSPSPWPSTDRSVLTVDANGDVILVHDEGSGIGSGTGDVKACAGINASSNNFVTKWSDGLNKEICNTQITDDGNNVGIGYASYLSPTQKLDVNGNINVTNSKGYYIANNAFLTSGGAGSNSDIELGFNAGPSGSSATTSSIFIGTNSGNSIGFSEVGNVFVGEYAGYNSVATSGSPSSASGNTFIGNQAGRGMASASGNNNVAVGNNASGQYSGILAFNKNVTIGYESGNQYVDIGNSNTLIGENTHLDVSGNNTQVDNSTAIGTSSWVGSNNTMVCGNANTQILMGYNVTPTSIGGGTISQCRLFVNPVGGSGWSKTAAWFDGQVYASGVYNPSDAALKDNIQPTDQQDISSILDRLNPSTYTFRPNQSINLSSGLQYGLIAEEVEQILPALVSEFSSPSKYDSTGTLLSAVQTFKGINYVGLVPILVASIKNQQHVLDSVITISNNLSNRLDQLESAINSCCNSAAERNAGNKIDVELNSENTIILNQNDPNPFAEQTRITFNIPSDVLEAKIIFFDNSGHVLQTVKINERGQGQINVYGEKLSSGIYSYSLIADGKVIDTKKMICVK